jgi:hypothetical protein
LSIHLLGIDQKIHRKKSLSCWRRVIGCGMRIVHLLLLVLHLILCILLLSRLGNNGRCEGGIGKREELLRLLFYHFQLCFCIVLFSLLHRICHLVCFRLGILYLGHLHLSDRFLWNLFHILIVRRFVFVCCRRFLLDRLLLLLLRELCFLVPFWKHGNYQIGWYGLLDFVWILWIMLYHLLGFMFFNLLIVKLIIFIPFHILFLFVFSLFHFLIILFLIFLSLFILLLLVIVGLLFLLVLKFFLLFQKK